ncbi:germinal-center associated nuclear protein [Fopius arisanus]|uniref:Germinal-center associated nuclear protein n=1 Tax=Fopius arisanus TaxID=64838 RepID=A0A9R1T6B3_9HYME|nr:PREDICTED: germinal-center associated nuclear protein [Fopius arisanus]
MSEGIVGTCSLMCPDEERRFRERKGWLHRFEIDDSQKHSRRPNADNKKIIKCYIRSGPGKSLIRQEELRPGPVLLSTLQYLFTQIATRSDADWAVIYNFIFDRLRAIRQDMTVQRLDSVTTIQILEPIVRFHVYSAQRLCDRSLEEFVPKFNDDHLLECIKELLVRYDERDRHPKNLFCSNRAQMETLYVLLYLGNCAAIERALSLPLEYKESPSMRMALKISRAWYLKNYVKVCRLIVKLSPLMAMAAITNLPKIRRDALLIMSAAYNSTQLSYPSDHLRKILLFKNKDLLHNECRHFGLEVIHGNIRFEMFKFKKEEKNGHLQKVFSDDMLNSFLPNIILHDVNSVGSEK